MYSKYNLNQEYSYFILTLPEIEDTRILSISTYEKHCHIKKCDEIIQMLGVFLKQGNKIVKKTYKITKHQLKIDHPSRLFAIKENVKEIELEVHFLKTEHKIKLVLNKKVNIDDLEKNNVAFKEKFYMVLVLVCILVSILLLFMIVKS